MAIYKYLKLSKCLDSFVLIVVFLLIVFMEIEHYQEGILIDFMDLLIAFSSSKIRIHAIRNSFKVAFIV